MESNWLYDSETYCDACLPVSADHPEVADGSGEQDVPANCCGCGRPVDYSLTTEGVEYVLDSIKESIRRRDHLNQEPDDSREGYYAGSPCFAVVRDWAEDLNSYWLTTKQENLVHRYLEMTSASSQES